MMELTHLHDDHLNILAVKEVITDKTENIFIKESDYDSIKFLFK